MAGENLGANFTIDITQLKAGLAQANRLIRESESEFRAAAAGMDKWQDSEDGVSAKIKSLNDVIGLQKEKVNALQAQYDDLVSNGLDPAGRQAVELRTKINRETEALNKNETELKKQTDALDKLQNASDDAADAVEDVGDEAEQSKEGFTVMKGAISNLIANGISALISKCGEVVSTIAGMADETREYREDMGKLKTAFEAAGKSTKTATKTYKEFYSVLGEEDRSVEAVNHLAKFVDTEEDMAKWTDICAGVWGTFGDSLPIEGLTEASNETAKVGKVTGVLADALNWAGVKEDDFNESLSKCATEQERAKKITDTLNGLYSDAARLYRENNKEVIESRKATSDLTDAQAELGKAMEPVQTKVAEMKTEFYKGLTPVLTESVLPAIQSFMDELEKSGVVQSFSEGIGKLAEKALPVLANVLKFVVDNMNLLLDVSGALLAGFFAAKTVTMITNMVTQFQSFITVLKSATTAQKALNAAQAANLIGAVTTGIVLLVQGLKSLVEMSDEAVNGWDRINAATQENIDINSDWQESMDSARATLGDYSNMTTAAGDSTTDLEQKMRDAQDNITQIYADAYAENRGLREEEIAAVRQYNDDYVAAQNELKELQGAILEAQTQSLEWQLNNLDLSEQEIQGIMNSLEETRTQYIEFLDGKVAEEIAILDMRLQKGEISEKEYEEQRKKALESQKTYREESKKVQEGVYQDGIEQLKKKINLDSSDFTEREKHFTSVKEIHEHYNEKIKALEEDENKSGWAKFWERQAIHSAEQADIQAFAQGMEVSWTNYNFMTDKKISANTQAYFNWLGQTKKYGGEITQENKDLASDILDAYKDLPEDLEESGIDALKGLLEGIDDSGEHEKLIGSADATAADLIKAIESTLGVNSPSWKTAEAGRNLIRGLREGTNDNFENNLLFDTASSIAQGILNTFSSIFQEHSPSRAMRKKGLNLGKGLAIGIDESTRDVLRAARGQMSELNDAYGDGIIDGTYTASVKTNAAEPLASGNNGVVVYQTNNYSQAHSRYEIYKSKQQTAAAVRLALKGV